MKTNGKDIKVIRQNGVEFSRVMRNGVELWNGTGLPSGYTLLEYIENTSTSYLDTGISPSTDLEVEIEYAPTGNLSEGGIFGSTWAANGYFLMTYSNVFRFHSRNYVFDDTNTLSAGKSHIVKTTTSSITIDGVTTSWTQGTTADSTSSITVFYATGYSAAKYGIGRLYSMKMWQGGTLVRDFIPCMNASNVCGLFDKVNKVFYPSASSTPFTGLLAVKLPNGYTLLEYIESTGGQYIDTGFIPNQDTRLTMDVQLTESPSSNIALFGASTTVDSQYNVYYIPDSRFVSDFCTGSSHLEFSISPMTRLDIDHNKNYLTINGTTQTHTYAVFSSQYKLALLANNAANSVSWYASAKLYSCKIHDNGTLIRDFVPCINPLGVYGLYDKVNGVFYPSATSTAFTGA